jgi:superfamily II DNA helicase RecQ
MGKGQRNRDNRILRQPQVSEHPTTPKMISLLDKMEDGREYESIVKLKNVSWQLNEELKHSISEIESIRQRPLICYMANVLNRNITKSTSIDNLDDVPFLEMLRNVPENKNGLDIILVTPGGSAETVNYFVNQI